MVLHPKHAAAYIHACVHFLSMQLSRAPVQVDVEVDRMMFERLRSCSAVEAASSEEQPEVQQLPGKGYTVSRDWKGRAAAERLGWNRDSCIMAS